MENEVPLVTAGETGGFWVEFEEEWKMKIRKK